MRFDLPTRISIVLFAVGCGSGELQLAPSIVTVEESATRELTLDGLDPGTWLELERDEARTVADLAVTIGEVPARIVRVGESVIVVATEPLTAGEHEVSLRARGRVHRAWPLLRVVNREPDPTADGDAAILADAGVVTDAAVVVDAAVAPDAAVDAGTIDAGRDAGIDAGAMDAGASDAGASDAGSDAGTIDGGASDAGTDAGPPGTVAPVIAAGRHHTCVVLPSSDLACWGRNDRGQLGTSGPDRPIAALVPGITGVAGVALGEKHTCALTATGHVWCWGWNDRGQLGSTGGDRSAPTRVTGVPPALDVAAGAKHTCALTATGDVWCWGANDRGQLGDGRTSSRVAPARVPGLTGVTAVGSGFEHTCAVDATGALHCWGHNDHGQIGDGTTSDARSPVLVAGLSSPAVRVQGGDAHTCALLRRGDVACWGDNDRGQVGDPGSSADHRSPFIVATSMRAGWVSTGHEQSCAAWESGGAVCWGRNDRGQLGDATRVDRSSPVVVMSLSARVQIASGWEHTCAASATEVWCWGHNNDGELGNGTTTDAIVPVSVTLP